MGVSFFEKIVYTAFTMKHLSLSLVIAIVVIVSAVSVVVYRFVPKTPNDKQILAEVTERVKDKPIEQKDEYIKQVGERLEKLEDKEEDNDASALTYTAVYYNNLGEKELALDYYLRALEKDPKNRLARHNLASLYEDMSRWDKADGEYRRLLEDHPTYIPGYRGLAYLYQYRFPDPDSKIAPLFEKGLAATKNHPDLLNWLVAYYQETGQPEKAVPFSTELARQLNAQKGSAPSTVEIVE